MPLNSTLYIAAGSAVVLALFGLLIWALRRSAFKHGVAVTETKHTEAVLHAQHEGDVIVAAKRDPLDVAEQLSNNQF